MKYLIVNADDFGYSFGINKGIIEAHKAGIVTSTSVMVDAIASEEARELADFPDLSIGLHFVISPAVSAKEELARQVKKFIQIVSAKPDHIDTHKSTPVDNPAVKVAIEEYVTAHPVPVRCFGQAKFIDSFFGLNVDGSGVLNPSNVSLESLKTAIDQATDEYNELMCHVGYSDDYLRKTSSYNDMREKELETLTNPVIREYIEQTGLVLSNWSKVKL